MPIEHGVEGRRGTLFAVWAPNARRVSVIGNFKGWDPDANPLAVRWDGSGIWEGFVPGPTEGELYKYHIESRIRNYKVDKGDPVAFRANITDTPASPWKNVMRPGSNEKIK